MKSQRTFACCFSVCHQCMAYEGCPQSGDQVTSLQFLPGACRHLTVPLLHKSSLGVRRGRHRCYRATLELLLHGQQQPIRFPAAICAAMRAAQLLTACLCPSAVLYITVKLVNLYIKTTATTILCGSIQNQGGLSFPALDAPMVPRLFARLQKFHCAVLE